VVLEARKTCNFQSFVTRDGGGIADCGGDEGSIGAGGGLRLRSRWVGTSLLLNDDGAGIA